MAKVKRRTQLRPKIQFKNFLWTRKIHIAFYFLRLPTRKSYVAQRNSEMPRAQNKIFEKAARFLSQLFLWTRKIHIAFYFLRLPTRKSYVAQRNSEMPRAQNKIFEKAARFLSQLFPN